MTDLTPEQVADGWIAYGRPLDLRASTRVSVMFRNGLYAMNKRYGDLDWLTRLCVQPLDIIAYRVEGPEAYACDSYYTTRGLPNDQ